MNKIGLAIIGLAVFGMIYHANYAFADQDSPIFYGKGMMTQGPLPGEVVRTLINKDVATIIHQGTNGIEVVRIDIRPSNMCVQTEATLCFEGTVTEAKNIEAHKVGDEIGITLDLKNKKEIVSFISGTIYGASVTIDLSKLIVHLDDPHTITLTQEGGIAGIQNEITINTTTWDLTQDDSTTQLDTNSINDLTKHIKKLKLFDIDEADYPAIAGSADYFAYSLTISQGIFHKTITWTDTSENVPNKITAIKDTIIKAAQSAYTQIPDTMQIQIAKDFVTSSPTFAFDGLPQTLAVHDAMVLESFPEQHVITIDFTSRHGGYGDRTGKIVTQA